MRKYRPRKQPESAHVDIEGFVPLLLGDLFNCSRMKYPGVVDKHINAAERFDCLFDHASDVSLLRNVRCDGYRRGACFTGCILDSIFAPAYQNDVGTLAGQCECTGTAYAAACTGHDCCFVFQA